MYSVFVICIHDDDSGGCFSACEEWCLEEHTFSTAGQASSLQWACSFFGRVFAKGTVAWQVLFRDCSAAFVEEVCKELRLQNSNEGSPNTFRFLLLQQGCGSADPWVFSSSCCQGKQLQRKIIFPGQAIVEEGIESQDSFVAPASSVEMMIAVGL